MNNLILKSIAQVLRHLLKRFWRILTEPFETLPHIERRFAVISAIFLFIGFVGVCMEQMIGGNTPPVALIILAAGYLIARTRWYRIAIFVLLVTLSFPSYLVALTISKPDSGILNDAFFWIILPLILSSLVYSVRTTIIFSALNIFLISALPFIRSELTFKDVSGSLGFYFMVVVFVITVMTQRDELEKDRQKELIQSRNQLADEFQQRKKFAEQAQRRADQLVMLNEISRVISNLQNVDEIMEVVLEQVKRVIPLDVFFIALYDEPSDGVFFPIMFDNENKWQQKPISLQRTNRIAHVIRSRQPFLLNRTKGEVEESKLSDIHLGDQSQIAASVIMCPLQIGTRMVGVISAQSYNLNIYTSEHLMLLTAIAQQIVVAIENARLHEQTEKRSQRLAILNEVGREISALSDLPTLMQKIYDQVQKALSVDLFFINLIDEKKNEISFPFMYDNGQRWEQAPKAMKDLDGTFTWRTIETQKPLLINEWSDSAIDSESNPKIVGDKSKVTKSLMLAPLLFGRKTIGIISAQSYTSNTYSDEDLGLLSGIAYQVAIAIQNTRLLEETRQNSTYLATLNQLGQVVSELRNLPDLLEVIYEQVKKNLHVDAFFVGLYHPENKIVTYPIMYDEAKKYDLEPDELTEHSFLYRLLHGGTATLILRTPEEIDTTTIDNGMLGNDTKKSASLLIAPLKVSEHVIGLISVQSYTLNAYNEDDLNLLVGIGNQVGVAIQNARLVEEIKQNARHLSILNEVGRAVSELRDLPELLEVVYEQGKKSISLDVFIVGLYHPDIEEVSFPIMYDSGVRYEQTRGIISKNSFLRRFLNGEKSILMLRTKEELQEGITYQKTLGREDKMSASLIAAPLLSRDKVIGMISAQSYSMNAYDDKDVNLLEGIANQVSIAIENSQLFTAAQQEITERQKAEEQLRAAETKYRQLVERVPAVIYSAETGATGRWFYVSPQIETLLGFTPNEWTAEASLWYQQIHPEDREHAVLNEEQSLTDKSKLETEYRMLTKDGRVIWVQDESISVSVSENQNYIVQGILTDITMRKQAENTLKESEERYHSLFLTAGRQAQELALLGEVQSSLAREVELPELMRTVVEAIAKAFGYTYVSLYVLDGNFLRLQHQVGYEPSNIIEEIPIDKGISGRVIRTGQALIIEDITQEPEFLNASIDVRSEICVPLFDGDMIFGTLNVESSLKYPLTKDDLRLMNALSEQINVALRRTRLYVERAESLRREQNINEFAHAINSTLDLPNILEIVTKLTVDLVGAETGTISIMSDDGQELTNVYNFNEDPTLNAFVPTGQGLTWQVYETGRPVILDEYSEHPRALPEWAKSGMRAFMCVPINIGSKRIGALALYNRTPGKKFTQRDLSMIEVIAQEIGVAIQNARLFEALQKELSEHKITQQQLLALVDELEIKNAELERFTYTVSHDLKSPIVTIGGFLGFLEADIQKQNYEKIPNTINRIREAAKKMERLLNELLELSRVGRIANPSADIPFGELVSETLELVDGQLREMQVEVKVDANLPLVHVDRVRMVEVIQNLITNAVKFMGNQRNPEIHIGMEIQGGENVFFVRDNGIGIAPEFHERIFGLFNKLDQFMEGTGIGLALVKRIIEVHGGKIWVESELGKGATFFFTLENKDQEETL